MRRTLNICYFRMIIEHLYSSNIYQSEIELFHIICYFSNQGPPTPMEIRAMIEEDWEAVFQIYKQGIVTGFATFEASPPPDME